MNEEPAYWFPAKRYGWGWGFPCTWQGWIVFLLYVSSVVAVSIYVPPDLYPLWFSGLLIVLTLALIGICLLKGEAPRWRWGAQDR